MTPPPSTPEDRAQGLKIARQICAAYEYEHFSNDALEAIAAIDRAEAAEARLRSAEEALRELIEASDAMGWNCNSGMADRAIKISRDHFARFPDGGGE